MLQEEVLLNRLAHRAKAFPGLCSMERKVRDIIHNFLNGMIVYSRKFPQPKLHPLLPWLNEAIWVNSNCLWKRHVSPVRFEPGSSRSLVQRATAPQSNY